MLKDPPLVTPVKPRRDIAAEMVAEGRAARAQRQAGMTVEQLMTLQKQIEAARERGDNESYRRLRERHYRETGASGG